jgi:hypothetical protein
VPKGLYVETLVRAPLDRVWEATQDPARHERWDLRFSTISYLPRPDPERPQEFRYATRIGFGQRIEGWGRSMGTHEKDGTRTSALEFGSDDPKSLIREGSGYWRYIPEREGATRFLTWYDYRTRFGAFGRLADLAFRPLIGWATALSFDRLRLWLERGIDPASSLRAFWVHAAARWGLAAVFLWQGLVPKVLRQHEDELAMVRAGGVPDAWASEALLAVGLGEAVFGLVLLATWRWRTPLLAAAALMPVVMAGVLLTAPRFGASAFNVVSLNTAVAALAVAGWLAAADAPSAGRTRRRPA